MCNEHASYKAHFSLHDGHPSFCIQLSNAYMCTHFTPQLRSVMSEIAHNLKAYNKATPAAAVVAHISPNQSWVGNRHRNRNRGISKNRNRNRSRYLENRKIPKTEEKKPKIPKSRYLQQCHSYFLCFYSSITRLQLK